MTENRRKGLTLVSLFLVIVLVVLGLNGYNQYKAKQEGTIEIMYINITPSFNYSYSYKQVHYTDFNSDTLFTNEKPYNDIKLFVNPEFDRVEELETFLKIYNVDNAIDIYYNDLETLQDLYRTDGIKHYRLKVE